jgi:hypothetical protein
MNHLRSCLAISAAILASACGSDGGTEATRSGDAGVDTGAGSGGRGTGGAPGSGGARAGGTGGLATGGLATSGGAGGAGIRCGTATCTPVAISAALTIDACCPTGTTDLCGFDVSAAAALIGISAGCIETDQAGANDTTCPNVTPPSTFDGGPSSFAGCCRADHTCGARVDLDGVFSGLNFGCVSTSTFQEAGAPRSCGIEAGPGDAEAGPPPMCSTASP